MVDLSPSSASMRQHRCRTRAKAARRGAWMCHLALAGLIGASVISDPAILTVAQRGMDAATSQIALRRPDRAGGLGTFAPPPAVTRTVLYTLQIAQTDRFETRPLAGLPD